MPPANLIVKTGDQAIFNPTFGPATVVVAPGVITGSGQGNVDGSIFCVQGDESSVSVPGVMYVTATFTIPGAGTLTIAALGGDQIAKKTNSSQKATILIGSTFTARFTVTVPAQQPTGGGPVPDPTPMYSGTGQFVTTNARSNGS